MRHQHRNVNNSYLICNHHLRSFSFDHDAKNGSNSGCSTLLVAWSTYQRVSPSLPLKQYVKWLSEELLSNVSSWNDLSYVAPILWYPSIILLWDDLHMYVVSIWSPVKCPSATKPAMVRAAGHLERLAPGKRFRISVLPVQKGALKDMVTTSFNLSNSSTTWLESFA